LGFYNDVVVIEGLCVFNISVV